MRVLLATEAATGPPAGVYHLLGDDETESLCGTVDEHNLFGSDPCTILALEDAEQQGLQPCKRCLRTAANDETVDLQQFDSTSVDRE